MPQKIYNYAIIGTGLLREKPGPTGYGMANTHFPAFNSSGRVKLVAIADLVPDHSAAFLKNHGQDAPTYTDYQKMFQEQQIDIVSICTWPNVHSEIAIACAKAGIKVIHSEKPMSDTWNGAKAMKAAADEAGVLLSFNHQRRHIKLFQHLKSLLDDGAIGKLLQIEAHCPNLYDWGTHWFDMLQYYNNESDVEWVIGQIESHTEHRIFGQRHENQGMVAYRWKNGVMGVLLTGSPSGIGCAQRIIGQDGIIEVLNERKYRMYTSKGSPANEVEIPQGDLSDHQLTALDVIRQLDEPGHISFLNANNAIRASEIGFAAYYSSLRRGRVDLPLTYGGNAFSEMLDRGEIGPNRTAPEE